VSIWTSVIESEPAEYEVRLNAVVELTAHEEKPIMHGPMMGPGGPAEFEILRWEIMDSTRRFVVIPQRVLEAMVDYSQLEIAVKNECRRAYEEGDFGR